MSVSPTQLRQRLIDLAAQPYRAAGPFAFHFARGKLSGDPVFLAMLERGLFSNGGRVLDVGCGQGLLASWLLAAHKLHSAGEWPAGWPAPGLPQDIRGVDMLERDIARAQAALPAPARFEHGDMRHTEFGSSDVVVIMDVLHYVDFDAQNDVLRRVRTALPAGGLFLTRVGDAGAGLGFKMSNWVDRTVAFFRGNRLPPTYCRPLPDWIQALEALGFSVETANMNGNLPFANVMLVCRVR